MSRAEELHTFYTLKEVLVQRHGVPIAQCNLVPECDANYHCQLLAPECQLLVLDVIRQASSAAV